MAIRFPKVGKSFGLVVAVLAIAGLSFALGSLVSGDQGAMQTAGRTGSAAPQDGAPAVSPEYSIEKGAVDTFGSGEVAQDALLYGAPDAARSSASVATGQMIIRNSNVELRVDKIETALDSIRRIVRSNNATITDSSIMAGQGGGEKPLYAETTSDYISPATAFLTIRVEASKLDTLEKAITGVGTLISQNGSSSDVSQQHIDMSARLDNLKAQEKRLRGFFARATKVADLLQIEQELSRVRGEIESMQGQVDFLERQAALSTLTVSLTEPGPVVQPSGSDWGFVEAIRRGIQAAATLVTGLITLVIALVPVVLLAGIAIAIARLRHRGRKSDAAATGEPVAAEDEDETTS